MKRKCNNSNPNNISQIAGILNFLARKMIVIFLKIGNHKNTFLMLFAVPERRMYITLIKLWSK